MDDNYLNRLSKRVLDLVAPWDREYPTESENLKATAETITNNPQYVIEFLLDILDGYTS